LKRNPFFDGDRTGSSATIYVVIHLDSIQHYARRMIMTVKIFIKRNVSPDNILELTVLLKKLRALTLSQSGYIYGETLKRVDAENECLVISTWRSLDDWNTWLDDRRRISIQDEIDALLGEKTDYSAYEV
jgi:heme-degrading monooxygenase HmoA